MSAVEKRIQFPGAELKVISAGKPSNPSIVFIPGWAGHHAFWKNQIADFSNDFHVVAMDFPGFGDSTLRYDSNTHEITLKKSLFGKKTEPLTMDLLGGFVQECLDRLGIKDPILVGHSAGGALALNIAANAPHRVSRVIGADAFTFLDFYPEVPEEVASSIVEPMRADFDTAVRGVAESYFLPTSDPAIKAPIIDAMAKAPRDLALDILFQFLRWDMTDCLNRFDGPVHAISASTTLDTDAVQQALGNKVTVSSVADSGHFVMLEQPKIFNQLLREYLL